jgi:hypothetical protein
MLRHKDQKVQSQLRLQRSCERKGERKKRMEKREGRSTSIFNFIDSVQSPSKDQ